MEVNPVQLIGHWKDGYALDLHTLSSHPKTDPEGNNITDSYGHIQWDTKYTPIGDEMYKLKYKKDKNCIKTIASAASKFLEASKKKWKPDLIIPIPPSDTSRKFQPVYALAEEIAILTKIPVDFKILVKSKSTTQIKQLEDPEKRKELLKDAFSMQEDALNGRNILLFDDLYRSGETLNAVCDVLLNIGKAKAVYVLTVTKTRTKR